MKKAVVLLSGGLDSTTCLAIAKQSGFACYALWTTASYRTCRSALYAEKAIDAFLVGEYHTVFLSIPKV